MAHAGTGTGTGRRLLRAARRPARRIVLVAVAVLCAAFVTASSLLFVWPGSDRPRRVDAVLVLNGEDSAARTRLAMSLMADAIAPVLLLSLGSRYDHCPEASAFVITCFVPRPLRTVGEIDFADRYARAHRISSILVVAGREQATRARLLAHRCFAGRSFVVAAPTAWREVPWQVVYEWGALVKAGAVATGCS